MILNLSFQFDKSTFSLREVSESRARQAENKGKEGDGEGVYWDQDQNEMSDIWIQSVAEGG